MDPLLEDITLDHTIFEFAVGTRRAMLSAGVTPVSLMNAAFKVGHASKVFNCAKNTTNLQGSQKSEGIRVLKNQGLHHIVDIVSTTTRTSDYLFSSQDGPFKYIFGIPAWCKRGWTMREGVLW